MITKEQEQFIKNYMPNEYFDSDKVISYLKIHDMVGDEIFDLALKKQTNRNIRLVKEGFGFNVTDTETFIRRVPFYFYEPDFSKGQHGDLLSFFSGRDNIEAREDIERIYRILEKLFYYYKINIADVLGYTIKVSGSYCRNDIFYNWIDYLDLCESLNIDNKCPKNFLYEYNRVLALCGKDPIIYEPGLIGYNENFLRMENEIIISGEFPCDYEGNPVLKWIGVWIEDADYVRTSDCISYGGDITLEKELHIGLTPTTKIYMPNIYNDEDESCNVWYPIHFGPLVMEFDKHALEFFRNRRGLTQKKVADSVGVNVRTYQKWERGESIPDGYNLIRLMNYLNIDSVQSFVANYPFEDDNFKTFRNRKKYN